MRWRDGGGQWGSEGMVELGMGWAGVELRFSERIRGLLKWKKNILKFFFQI